jgi:hypothetical protein
LQVGARRGSPIQHLQVLTVGVHGIHGFTGIRLLELDGLKKQPAYEIVGGCQASNQQSQDVGNSDQRMGICQFKYSDRHVDACEHLRKKMRDGAIQVEAVEDGGCMVLPSDWTPKYSADSQVRSSVRRMTQALSTEILPHLLAFAF